MKYEISNVTTKVLSEEFEDAILALKVTVKNLSRDEDVYITLQGIDEDGFELAEITISAEIPVGEERTLTTKEDINSDLCHKIVEWQLK